MPMKVSEFVLRGKAKLGNPHMSDREFGKRLPGGYAQTTVSNARYGNCSDRMAVVLAELLDIEPGLVLWVARAEREKDPDVRKHLESWGAKVGKVLGSVHTKTSALVVGALVALSLLQPAPNVQTACGGEGR
jgi:hypothetical protein